MLDHGQYGPSTPFPEEASSAPLLPSTTPLDPLPQIALLPSGPEAGGSDAGQPEEAPTSLQDSLEPKDIPVPTQVSPSSQTPNPVSQISVANSGTKPLILSNPICSGYFIEPVR